MALRGNELNEIQWVADNDVYTAASVELMKLMKLIAAATIEWINKINEFNDCSWGAAAIAAALIL